VCWGKRHEKWGRGVGGTRGGIVDAGGHNGLQEGVAKEWR
jgi:hypothetical protein